VRSGSKGVPGGRPEAVRIKLLGGFSVSVGSRTIVENEWRLTKAASLVKLLALTPGHRMHREQAMDLLWPDSSRKAASNSLRKTLHAARRVLDPAVGSRYLASHEESLVLCPGGDLWVDAEAFEEAAAVARRAKEPAAYRAALDLYLDDLLPGDRYEEWAEGGREELRRAFLSLLVEMAGIHEQRGEYEPGIEALRKVIGEEPTNQEAHLGLMRLYALSGRQAEALAQYARLEESLSRELGVEPDASSRVLREEIAAGRFPPPDRPVGPRERESLDPLRHNLPAPRTSFVGRDREMVEVKRTLAMTRLLTLTGAGGSGKTRLALEVARDLVGAYADGVWLVELAGLSEPDLVPQAVAGALGVSEQPGQPLTSTLIDVLRTKQMLLVLDNCEHLVEAAAQLVDVLLDSCLKLRILATSREALAVVGEVRWTVPALSSPDLRGPLSVRELEGYESVRLFVERARQRDTSFAPKPDNAQAVAEICRKLDGIPLAVELAAVRVGALGVSEIARRLEDSLSLLTSGVRTAVARQRTLRGALDWSHDLLGESEQILFRRLSVFVGSWTLEAVEAVGRGEGVAQGDVLELLSGLLDKSLVVIETTSDEALRYGMLEPIRQYAREKLEDSGEAEAILLRHAKFFLDLAEEAEKGYFGPGERKWLNRLESEHDNMRAALSWSLKHGERETTLRLAGALSRFWETRGYVSEGARWLEEALDKDDGAVPTARAGALLGLGDMLTNQSAFARAEACFEDALRLYEELGDRGSVAESLVYLGWVAEYRGDPDRAAALFEESMAVVRESENRTLLPNVLNGLGWITFNAGDFERARALWAEALEMERELGSNMVASGVLFNMGYTELTRGNHKQATALLEESLAIGREMGDKAIVAAALLGLGIAATLRSEPNEAETLLKEGLATELELGNKMDIAEYLEAFAGAAGALDEDLRAARLWGAAGALREATGSPWGLAERLLHEPLLVATRSRLDGAVWEAAFAEGKAMNLEEAVEYALSEEEPAPTASPAPEQPSADEVPTLTRRETEIATLVAQGMTNRQIATELVISEHTAATHVRRILKKLGLHSRSQLSSWITALRPPSSDLG
jgi:predicted ATPase/DNA-binding SARP family transcriptional activator/DNA-binding CsgD family transcriptional regulator/Tfp pilus assembly protein PilF